MELNQFYVGLRNTTCPMVYFTASLQDEPIIREHHWRLIDGKIVTTVISGTIEVKATLDHVLFGCNRKKTLKKKNNNELDYSRENIRLTERSRNNIIEINSESSYLLVNDNTPPVIIDTEDIEKIEKFYWSCINIKGNPTILTVYQEDGKSRRRQLARYVLDLSPRDSRIVEYIDGDRFNLRKDNLTMRQR